MAHELCNKLDKLEGKEKKTCDGGCEHYRFPHLKTACVLSEVYSVPKGEGCYIYKEKHNSLV